MHYTEIKDICPIKPKSRLLIPIIGGRIEKNLDDLEYSYIVQKSSSYQALIELVFVKEDNASI